MRATPPAGCPGNQVSVAGEACMAVRAWREVAKMTNAEFQGWVLGSLGVLGSRYYGTWIPTRPRKEMDEAFSFQQQTVKTRAPGGSSAC